MQTRRVRELKPRATGQDVKVLDPWRVPVSCVYLRHWRYTLWDIIPQVSRWGQLPVGTGHGRQTLDFQTSGPFLQRPSPSVLPALGSGAAGSELGLRCPTGIGEADSIGEVTHTQLATHRPRLRQE